MDFPLPGNIYDSENAKKDQNEIEQLRNLVKELEEREVKLEAEVLEYYGLKEQESNILELQKHLKVKAVEIDVLNITITRLQDEKKRLQKKVSKFSFARKELEEARNKIKEMQKQIQVEETEQKNSYCCLSNKLVYFKQRSEKP
ncbi:unnamed protein product [Cuscuta campestris]|uniref:Uncharacterized protein n=1 Tax=Cuscuta campestris TaxID=132261 RepID=A0A484MC38_9ASTE|nr:unnamed protein product [Cuscuta campestris]